MTTWNVPAKRVLDIRRNKADQQVGAKQDRGLFTTGRLEAADVPELVKRYGDAVAPVASDGERRLFSGSDADIVDDLRALRDLGVTAIDVEVEGNDEAATIANMQRFRATIFSRLRRPTGVRT